MLNAWSRHNLSWATTKQYSFISLSLSHLSYSQLSNIHFGVWTSTNNPSMNNRRCILYGRDRAIGLTVVILERSFYHVLFVVILVDETPFSIIFSCEFVYILIHIMFLSINNVRQYSLLREKRMLYWSPNKIKWTIKELRTVTNSEEKWKFQYNWQPHYRIISWNKLFHTHWRERQNNLVSQSIFFYHKIKFNASFLKVVK